MVREAGDSVAAGPTTMDDLLGLPSGRCGLERSKHDSGHSRVSRTMGETAGDHADRQRVASCRSGARRSLTGPAVLPHTPSQQFGKLQGAVAAPVRRARGVPP